MNFMATLENQWLGQHSYAHLHKYLSEKEIKETYEMLDALDSPGLLRDGSTPMQL